MEREFREKSLFRRCSFLVKNIELFSDAKASKALAPTMRQDNLKRAKAKYEENHEDLEAVLA